MCHYLSPITHDVDMNCLELFDLNRFEIHEDMKTNSTIAGENVAAAVVVDNDNCNVDSALSWNLDDNIDKNSRKNLMEMTRKKDGQM